VYGFLAGLLSLTLSASDTVPVFTLDPVPVVGSRVSPSLPLSTRGVQVLDRAHLDRVPASTVADVLRIALGLEVSSRSPAQTDLQLRGGSFEQVLVLVDGVRVSDAQTGHFDLNLALPLDQVERIEILRGPGSAQYGSDAIGGVINIVTRAAGVGDRRAWGVRVEGGTFGTGTLALQQEFRLPAGLRVRTAGEFGRSDGHRPGTEWAHDLASLDVAAPLQGGTLRAQGGLARRDFGAKDFYAPFPSVEETGARTLRVQWNPAPDQRIHLTPGLHWRRHTDDFILIRDRPEVYRNLHTSIQQGADLTLRVPIGASQMAALGLEWAEHELTSSALGDHLERRYAMFGELSGTFLDRIDLSLGIRRDGQVQQVDGWDGVTSPSVAASWAVHPAARLRASFGRAFRAPTWTERYYADPGHIPNPDLGPERGHAWEVGIQGSVGSGLTWSLAGHERSMRDLIDWARPVGGARPEAEPGVVVAPAPWVPRNVGRAVFTGFEGEARWTGAAAGGPWIGVHLSVLQVRSDAPAELESKYALRPLVQQAGLEAGFELLGGWGVVLSGVHGKRGGPGLATSDGSHRELDVRLQHATGWRGIVPWIDARNLFGSTHLDLTGNPVPGRRWMLGVRTGGSR
jgi:iron complex outermembrane receptor protein